MNLVAGASQMSPFGSSAPRLEHVRRRAYSQRQMGSRRVVAVVVAVAALAAAVAAWAASPPEGPQLEAMALATTDFARGASVVQEGFVPASPPVVARFDRIFHSGARLNGQRLLGAASYVTLVDADGVAMVGFTSLANELSTSAGRREIAAELKHNVAASTRGLVKVKSVTFGRVHRFQAAAGAFRVTIKLHTNRGVIELALVGIVLDRALGVVELDGYPRKHVSASTAVVAARKLAQHFQVAFQIRSVLPPTITGTPQLGQTLTADRGRWAGGPSSFTYQWNDCDAAGANCAPIAGAVAPTYVPGTADAGMRLTVTVTATNDVSSKPVTSAPTAPVS
jgi:hypothetical protein